MTRTYEVLKRQGVLEDEVVVDFQCTSVESGWSSDGNGSEGDEG